MLAMIFTTPERLYHRAERPVGPLDCAHPLIPPPTLRVQLPMLFSPLSLSVYLYKKYTES